MKIKKFFFNDLNLEQFYIKNGFVIIKNGIEKKFRFNSLCKKLNLIVFNTNAESIKTSNKEIMRIRRNFINPLRFFLSSYKPIKKTTDGKTIHVKHSAKVFICIILV